jgi:branched-chain amino acid transport system permease protein
MTPRGRIGIVMLLAGACVAPFALSSFHTFQLTQILIYAIALLGLNLLTGYSGQISLGHGAFYGIGAYVAAILLGHGWLPYWAAVPVAGITCMVAGFAFGLPALRLEGPYLALATFALAVAMPQILKHDRLEKWTGGVQGTLIDKPASPLANLFDGDQWLYFFCLACLVAIYLVSWNLVHGRTGRALVAIRDHPIAAATMGIDTALHKSIVFGVSAMYTGVAGALGALLTGFVSPDSFTAVVSIYFLVGVVVGGIASVLGNLFGAAFIVIVPNVAEDISRDAPQVIYGVLLIAFILLMPRGVAGLVRSVSLRRPFWKGARHV